MKALTRIPSLIDKDKEMTREWVLLKDMLDSLEKRVIARPHVRVFLANKYFSPAIEGNHATFFRNSTNSSVRLNRMIFPFSQLNSIMLSPETGVFSDT